MHSKERGVALITVLLIVATVSVLAVQLNDQVRFSTQRTMNRTASEQAYWYAHGGETLAMAQLAQALKKDPQAVLQLLAQPANFALGEGRIRYRLTSLHSCFNINSLMPSPEQDGILRRFKALGTALSVPSKEMDALAELITDWLTNGGEPAAESNGYRIPLMMTSEAELSSIWPQDAALEPLRALVCVRPDDGFLKVNPNHLQPEHVPLLRALFNNKVKSDKALELINKRPERGYFFVEEFFHTPAIEVAIPSAEEQRGFSTESEYFRSHVEVTYREASFAITSLLHWDGKNVKRVYGQIGY